MKIVRRIAAVLGMLLAIIFFVGLVGLIAGIWLGRQPIVDGVLGAVAPFDYAGRSATDLIDQTSAELAVVKSRLEAAQVRTKEFLAAPEQQAEAGAELRDQLSAALGTDIGAVATQVQTQLAAVSRAVQAADQSVAAAVTGGPDPARRASGDPAGGTGPGDDDVTHPGRPNRWRRSRTRKAPRRPSWPARCSLSWGMPS